MASGLTFWLSGSFEDDVPEATFSLLARPASDIGDGNTLPVTMILQ